MALKRSIIAFIVTVVALRLAALSLGPVTKAMQWVWWACDGYVKIWFQWDDLFIAQCCLCAVVACLYMIILFRSESGDYHLAGASERNKGGSIIIKQGAGPSLGMQAINHVAQSDHSGFWKAISEPNICFCF